MKTIHFWLMPNSGFESKQTIEHELAVFARQYPGIEVKYEILSWTRSWQKLVQAIKEKNGPDVIQIGSTWIGTLAYLGVIQNLSFCHPHLENHIPAFREMCRCFDQYYALPWFCESRALYYRKDMLKSSGVELEELETWDLFRKACAKLHKHTSKHKSITPLAFSIQKEQVILQDLAAWLWDFGGDFLSEDGYHSTISKRDSLQGMNYFLRLISSGFINEHSLNHNSGELAENFFLHNSAAFMISSTWPLRLYLNPQSKLFSGQDHSENFGVTLLPAGPDGRYNFVGGSSLALTSFTRHPEEAWALVEFLTGRESQERYCRSINMMPTRSDVPGTLMGIETAQNVFQQAITCHGRSFSSHPLWGSLEQVLVNGFTRSLRDYCTSNCSEKAFFHNINEMNREIETILAVFGE
jgi:multiple sugar transport system substrate-binding protein